MSRRRRGKTSESETASAAIDALIPPTPDLPIPSPEHRVILGSLVKPWGVRGDQTVHLYNPDSDLLERVDEVFLEGHDVPIRMATLRLARWIGKRYVIRLEGVETPEQAELLRGLELSVHESALPPLQDDDEFYVRDLIGMKVRTKGGEELGYLDNVMQTGSNDVWVVMGPQGEVLVPATKDFVLEIDVDEGFIRVDLVEL